MQGRLLSFGYDSRAFKHLSKTIKKAPSSMTILFIIVLLFGAYMYSLCIEPNTVWRSANSNCGNKAAKSTPIIPKNKPPQKHEIPITLNCSAKPYCTSNYRIEDSTESSPSSGICPHYFRWIGEDLKPWKETGISIEMVMRAKRTANFRLVILNGKAYMEIYKKSFHSRDINTLWGILQLLRKYPGKLPDLDLMFDCLDWPAIKSSDFYKDGKPINNTSPPPLFCYSGDDFTLDIVFPDWSFWGWPEINIKPWEILLEELKEGNKKRKWVEREPYAYWKGNPTVAPTRKDLMKCNVSDKNDWNARLYAQNWAAETRQGFQQSNLANQCTHRYKIYIEGQAWSVSEKYILACDSPTLIVKPKYYDFFTRSLLPMEHYWPVTENKKCKSIKFAVDWGNNNQHKAQDIGRAASKFIHEELKMEYVYDYMFHLLSEYSKLLKYKPAIPPNAVQICPETLACSATGVGKEFMMESAVKESSSTGPCSMPPPFDPPSLNAFIAQKENSIKQVENWETQSN